MVNGSFYSYFLIRVRPHIYPGDVCVTACNYNQIYRYSVPKFFHSVSAFQSTQKLFRRSQLSWILERFDKAQVDEFSKIKSAFCQLCEFLSAGTRQAPVRTH